MEKRIPTTTIPQDELFNSALIDQKMAEYDAKILADNGGCIYVYPDIGFRDAMDVTPEETARFEYETEISRKERYRMNCAIAEREELESKYDYDYE